MAESDEDYATVTSLEDNQSFPPVEEENEGDNVEKVRENLARKPSHSNTKPKPDLRNNLKALVPMIQFHAHSLKGQAIDRNVPSIRVTFYVLG